MLNGWKKGALHTHSFWSDGEAFPEQVVLRHLERGYDFVCLTDHNNLGLDPQHWLYVIQPEQGPFPEGLPYIGGCTWQAALERYQTDFPGIPETKTIAGRKYVRVRSLPEVKEIFRNQQNFAVIGGEELTTRLKTPSTRYQLDMGVLNLKQQMNYLSGETLPETLRLNKELYDHLRSQQEQSSLFIVNHPGGYYYDLAPEALIVQDDIRHFELCNSNVDGAGGEGSTYSRPKARSAIRYFTTTKNSGILSMHIGQRTANSFFWVRQAMTLISILLNGLICGPESDAPGSWYTVPEISMKTPL